ncbi:MAG TPA: HD domain-containing phosphohydrolase [Gemmatimonadales bacterium]|nr:HD domain-containing phosphohydrolase [Gemmatimonadales bacterium]
MADAAAPVAVLIVDDEEPIRSALRKFLTQQGYEVSLAGTAAEALAVARRQRLTAVLLDMRLPDRSGMDLLPDLLEVDADLAILMLTAVNDATTASLCIQRGATDYLTKPLDLDDLDSALRHALRRRGTRIEEQSLQHWLKEEVAVRSAELRRERAKLEQVTTATLEALVNALEAKDEYLRGHSARVADLAALVAAEMGLDDEQVEQLRRAGRLHDIGKIGISEQVLQKHGPLTPEEFTHVKEHVTIGSQILSPLTHLGDIIAFVRHHHEHWDGGGYPDGLKGEQIPLGARILGVVEIYDALTTARPYQERMEPDAAVARMKALSARVIDPTAYDALVRAVERRRNLVFLDDPRH